VILLIVFDEDIFVLFTAFSIAIFFIILVIATIAGYNAKGGYLTRNKIILMQEKMLREKKEEVLKESDILQKKVECVDYLGTPYFPNFCPFCGKKIIPESLEK
jgi:hypothetical protein